MKVENKILEWLDKKIESSNKTAELVKESGSEKLAKTYEDYSTAYWAVKQHILVNYVENKFVEEKEFECSSCKDTTIDKNGELCKECVPIDEVPPKTVSLNGIPMMRHDYPSPYKGRKKQYVYRKTGAKWWLGYRYSKDGTLRSHYSVSSNINNQELKEISYKKWAENRYGKI